MSPAPSDQQLHTFYEQYDEKHRRAPKKSAQQLATYYQGIDPRADLRLRKLAALFDFKEAQVLDIGFGRPSFLYGLKKLGANTFGLEVDPQAIAYAQWLGIEVFHGTLVDYVTDAKYDLISLLDFVEHPLNPMEVLKKCAALLKPGGFLLIWTPNGDFTRRDKHLITFRVDLEHMQYLTVDSCLYIASALKLRVVHLETLGFPLLDGIDQPLAPEEKPACFIKRMIKAMPGFAAVNHFKRKLWTNPDTQPDERLGAYHLFCILQKPA